MIVSSCLSSNLRLSLCTIREMRSWRLERMSLQYLMCFGSILVVGDLISSKDKVQHRFNTTVSSSGRLESVTTELTIILCGKIRCGVAVEWMESKIAWCIKSASALMAAAMSEISRAGSTKEVHKLRISAGASIGGARSKYALQMPLMLFWITVDSLFH